MGEQNQAPDTTQGHLASSYLTEGICSSGRGQCHHQMVGRGHPKEGELKKI